MYESTLIADQTPLDKYLEQAEGLHADRQNDSKLFTPFNSRRASILTPSRLSA